MTQKLLDDFYGRYPLSQPEDFALLLRLRRFGGSVFGENLSDFTQKIEDIRRLAQTNTDPLFLDLGETYCRLSLASPALSLSSSCIARMAFLSAGQNTPNTHTITEDLPALCRWAKDKPFSLCSEDWQALVVTPSREAFPSEAHSQPYKKQYHPAYLVLEKNFWRYFSAIERIDRLLQEKKQLLIAIDGPSGTGKSYLGRLLQSLFGADLILMDDFFLQPDQRSPARAAEPGGNVDYERFFAEVVANLEKHSPFIYQKYSCSTGLFSPSAALASPAKIFEGVYSLHPKWGAELFDCKIFLTASLQKRLERIENRNGKKMLARFVKEFIPKEDAYFNAFGVPALCDLTIDTTDF